MLACQAGEEGRRRKKGRRASEKERRGGEGKLAGGERGRGRESERE